MAEQEKKYREKSYIQESVEEGLLFGPAWTKGWGLKVSTWYGMDKIKFAFIEKGSKGKGKSFDVFVNTCKDFSFDFETFVHEFLHDIKTPYDFFAIMEAEKKSGKEDPTRYLFRTGEKGEKSVGICNSSRGGYCIKGTSGKAVAYIPVSYYDLYRIVERFVETYEERKNQLSDMRIGAIATNEERFKKAGNLIEEDPDNGASEDFAPSNNTEHEDECNTNHNTVSENTAPEAEAPSKVQMPAEIPKNEIPSVHVTTSSPITVKQNGDYSFSALKDDGTEIDMIIPAAIIAAQAKLFNDFRERVNTSGSDFRFTGEKLRTSGWVHYMFKAFA